MSTDKAALRAEMAARRAGAFDAAAERQAQDRLAAVLQGFQGKTVAGYAAMRGEIDPLPGLFQHQGPCCLPVVKARGTPLTFRAWAPGAALVEGAYGALIPAAGEELSPEVLVVPLLAFDGRLQRLGYGGGFYDRTLGRLREARGAEPRAITAIGFAWDVQQVPEVPVGPYDQPLDMIVTPSRLWRAAL